MNVTVPNFSTEDSLQPPEISTSPSLCPLCCEVDLNAPDKETATLSSCLHRSCKSCMVRWLEREESSGQGRPPTCPFCRSAARDRDVIAILGRPFESKRATGDGPNNGGEEEVDELTMQWLDEHTVPCGVCGSRIEKESGCDKIECLCGYRFCFRCGAANARCACNPGHGFDRNAGYIADDPIRDSEGRVDLGSCINRKNIRKERENRREENEREVRGRWELSRDVRVELGLGCTSTGKWLFSPKKNSRSMLMLTQQLAQSNVHGERRDKRRDGRLNASLGTSWLSARRWTVVLQQLLNGDRVRRSKKHPWRRAMEEADHSNADVLSLNLVALFLPNKTGIRLLEGVMDAVRKRTKRARVEDRELDFLSIDFFIESGAWLFHTSAPGRTHANLEKLLKHSAEGRNKRFNKRLQELFSGGCNTPNCPNPNCGGKNEDDQCLDSILNVFSQQGDE